MSGLRWSIIGPGLILAIWLSAALLGPWLGLHPNDIALPRILEGPSWAAWLGYDDLGRALADRLLLGARTSLLVALQVISISLVLGTLIGAVSAWFGGLTDRIIVHLIDVFLAFPGILLAIALSGLLGPGLSNVVIALSCVGWVGYARLARAQTLSLKQQAHVRAALALGASTPRILRWHVLPLLWTPLVVEATFGVAGLIIAEAGLSFLGLGVQPPTPSWGSMLRDGTAYMLIAPHLVIVPGFALMAVVLAINLLGDRLRDYLDVKMSRPRAAAASQT